METLEHYSPISLKSFKRWASQKLLQQGFLGFIRSETAIFLLEIGQPWDRRRYGLDQWALWYISKPDGSIQSLPLTRSHQITLCWPHYERCFLASTNLSPFGQRLVGTLLHLSNLLSKTGIIDSPCSTYTARKVLERLHSYKKS